MSGRVLVVEDEPTISRAVSYALEQEGFEVDCVERRDGGARDGRRRSTSSSST